MMDQTPARQDLPLHEEEIIVTPGQNQLEVHLRDHTLLSILSQGRQILGSHSPDSTQSFFLKPGTYTIRTDGSVEAIRMEAAEAPPLPIPPMFQPPTYLEVTSDAPDRHIADGIGEIPANGSSFTTITVRKLDMMGKLLDGPEDDEEVFVRTTGGRLLDESGRAPIRSIQIANGLAAFRVVSDSTPKVVTVSLVRRNAMAGADIQIEFI
jgi:hypothetical protein